MRVISVAASAAGASYLLARMRFEQAVNPGATLATARVAAPRPFKGAATCRQ